MPIWGFLLGCGFHRYSDGYRFGKLACDLVEKHGFIANRAKVYGRGWSGRHLDAADCDAIDFARTGIRTAIETGDPVFACYERVVTSRTPSPAERSTRPGVARVGDRRWTSPEKSSIDDTADIIVSQQRFIATMQGRTASFSTFSDAQFDEATFEAQLTGSRNPMMTCWYWILKLKARFLSGNYAEALAAADKAKPVLAATAGHIPALDYFYYAALTVSALYETASADQQQAWRELLTRHREQLREWAENYPPTFADKHALVSAEIARIEKRDADALASVRAGYPFGARERLRSERGPRPRTGGAVLPGARSRNGRLRPSPQRAELLRPLGRPRKSKATRRTLPAPARGTNSRLFGHDWPASRAVGRRDCRQSIAGDFE